MSVEPRSVPDPGPGELLVETRRSLISAGTELLVYRGDAPRDLPADETIDALSGTLDYPLQYGYAAVGRVRAVGPEVDPACHDRTVFAFNPHETHFLASPDDLVPVPDGVGPESATLLPNVETAVNLALDAAPRVGERAVVFGAGVVGLCTTAVLSAFPLSDLVVVDPVAARRAVAERLGATRTLAPAELDDLDWTDPDGADLAVEVSGSTDALDDAVETVGYDGRVVVGSWYGTKPVEANLGGHFHRGRVDIVSSQVSTLSPALRGRWTTERRLDTAWDHLRTVADADPITHRVPFADAAAAYDRLDGGPDEAVGVVLTYE